MLELSTRQLRQLLEGHDGTPDCTDELGELIPSNRPPCARCHRPQTPCRVGLPETEASWDPALSRLLKGVHVREGLAGPGWAGWSAEMAQQGFKVAPPVNYFEDPLPQQGARPESFAGGGPSPARSRRAQPLASRHSMHYVLRLPTVEWRDARGARNRG